MTLLSAPEVAERIGEVLADVDPPVQEGDGQAAAPLSEPVLYRLPARVKRR